VTIVDRLRVTGRRDACEFDYFSSAWKGLTNHNEVRSMTITSAG
jgi:hypothetical protein